MSKGLIVVSQDNTAFADWQGNANGNANGVCESISEETIMRKRMPPVILIVIVFALESVNAQLPKIPRIRKVVESTTATPSSSSPATPESNNSTSDTQSNSTGDWTQSREMVMDDAFTYFDAAPAKEVSAAAMGEIDVGWYLRSSLRAFGTFPAHSGFNVVVSKGGRELAKTRCETKPYRKADDMNLRTPEQRNGRDLGFDSFMQYSDCFDKTQFTKGEGEFDVNVYLFNGDTDHEKLVRTYKIDVHRAARVRGLPAKPLPDVAHYYVSRHAEAPVAFMHLTHTNVFDYWKFSNGQSTRSNRLEVYLNYSPRQAGDATPDARIRCSVNGERINFDAGNSYGDQVHFAHKGVINAIYLDRLAPQYKTGPAYRDDVAFVQVQVTLPIAFGQTEARNVKLQDHPGDWVCDLLANGKKFRTLHWKVGSDGNPVPHPEQQSGNVSLYYNAFVIDMEIPPGGSEFDYRLAPMPGKGFFYGIPWTTEAGKKMAASVPKKGNLYQVPSNQVK